MKKLTELEQFTADIEALVDDGYSVIKDYMMECILSKNGKIVIVKYGAKYEAK